MSKTQALREAGAPHSTVRHCSTRDTSTKGVIKERERIRADHLSAFQAHDIGPDAFARSMKRGLSIPNSSTQRLYAEIVGLVGDESAGKVLVVVLQQIMPVIMPFVPEDRRGDLLRQLKAAGTGGVQS
jgi:hypothetical protein